MAKNQRTKKFTPSKQRLFGSTLRDTFFSFVLFVIMSIISKDVLMLLLYTTTYLIVILLSFQFTFQKKAREYEIIISEESIYGMPEAPLYNGFEMLKKISINLAEVDKQKTKFTKTWYSSANLIWSKDGKNIIVSGAFEEDQLREMAKLIDCPVEI
jgi:hypothetical protein